MKKIVLIIGCILVIFNCTSTKKENNKSNNVNISKKPKYSNEDKFILEKLDEIKKGQSDVLFSGNSADIDRVILESKLLEIFEQWKGTKYSLGGDSKSGIDCSAFTRRIYRHVFDYELPRITEDQIKVGKKISINELKAGDILFFRPEERVNHTAVYLGKSLFLNASSSKGVVISTLNNSYWGKYFKYGVRVK